MESTKIGAQRIMKAQYLCILHILICTYLEYIYLAGVRVRFVTSLNLLEMTDKDFRGRGGGLNRLITS